MRRTALFGVCTAALALVPAVAIAVPVQYQADLTTLNDSGVTGTANLTVDEETNQLTVQITASGLEPGMPHPQHIHGQVSEAGNPLNSTTPTLAQDDDNDGFIELAEGLDTYGPILVPLTSPPGGAVADFPTAPDGTINFMQTYDLTSDATYAGDFTAEQLLPLDLREIVLHGMTVSADEGIGTEGEVNGMAGYKAVLPVASGEITLVQNGGAPQEVPEPSIALLLLTGFGAAFGMSRVGSRRRNSLREAA